MIVVIAKALRNMSGGFLDSSGRLVQDDSGA